MSGRADKAMTEERIVARRDEDIAARIVSGGSLPGVRAGSALVRVGERLLAVQDDAFEAVWVDPDTFETRKRVLRGSGEALGNPSKPGFEAAFEHDGKVYVLGSGVQSNRSCFARLNLAGGEAPLFNALPLYSVIEEALGHEPDIQGAVPAGDRLRLFHRGHGARGGDSAIIDVPLDAVSGGAPRVLALQRYDLGSVEGAPLAFTDATSLGRFVVYIALTTGTVTAAAIGILDARGARWDLITESDGTPSRRRFEGVALDPPKGAWLLTDPGDPVKPAGLFRIELKF